MKKIALALGLAASALTAQARVTDMSADQQIACSGHFAAYAVVVQDNRVVESAMRLSQQLRAQARQQLGSAADSMYKRQRDYSLMLLQNGAGNQIAAEIDQCLAVINRK